MVTPFVDSELDELRHFIRTCPVIDSHAHNLLPPDRQKSADFLTISTKARGDALQDTPKSLSQLRAVNQLKKLYGLAEDADWASILGKRTELLERDADAFTRQCFAGTQTILIDDERDAGANVETYSWHDRYTTSPCMRTVRIETVAANILSALYQQGELPIGVAIADKEACSLAWVEFITRFEQAILNALSDEKVVGFNSVICSRTGLDVMIGKDIEVTEEGLRSFRRHYLPNCAARKFRVEAKGMNDALVISVCKLITAGSQGRGRAKPLQFYTGSGGRNVNNLLESNPACLQPLIKHFPNVPFVLLQSSYPYTREAGYLATVYQNVHLDIGGILPMLSRSGQEQVIRQALELTPTSKILWSTDGHDFPETYWLANLQGRQALEKLICESVLTGDLSNSQARQAIANILHSNSNVLYGLSLPHPPGLHDAQPQTAAPNANVYEA